MHISMAIVQPSRVNGHNHAFYTGHSSCAQLVLLRVSFSAAIYRPTRGGVASPMLGILVVIAWKD